MTFRMRVLATALLLLALAAIAGAPVYSPSVDAQETCASRCLQAFAACYKRTQNRVQCEQVRETCIKQCKR